MLTKCILILCDINIVNAQKVHFENVMPRSMVVHSIGNTGADAGFPIGGRGTNMGTF